MLMTDGEIREAMRKGDLVIDPFAEDCLEPASYDMRIGNKALVSNSNDELNLEEKGSFTIKAGDFALVTTHEKVKLADRIAGHIGIKSYYTRKGMVLMAGLQIDPGFEGTLVLGIYNASPRNLTLDYLAPFSTVEFHQLSRPVTKPYKPGEEQKHGNIPRADKDYLRTLETQTLSELSTSVRQMTISVGDLTSSVKSMAKVMYSVILPVLLVVIGVLTGPLLVNLFRK